MDNLLSDRANVSRYYEDFSFKNLEICNSKPYDAEQNPLGYVNMGTSVNNICDDLLHPVLNDISKFDFDALENNEEPNTLRLREAMAKMMTEFLETYEPVSPDNLFCFNGVTSCMDLLAHCLADPGEVFLVPTPMYGRTYSNFMQRSFVEIHPIPVFTDDGEEPGLTMEKIICAYNSAVIVDNVVRGIFLINPNNPLGDIYSPKLLMDIMLFCSEKSLHLIVDEIYAMSVFSEEEKFRSILSFPSIPDPDRTHVLYGLSKDFGLAALRVGVIHTKCKQLQKCLTQLYPFHSIPYSVKENVATILEELEWCRYYINIYKRRLAVYYNVCVNGLRKKGVEVRKCHAGHFLWVDLRHLCAKSFDGEKQLFNYFMNTFRLYIGPGEEFFCDDPGWFRIVFTQRPANLEEGLKRFTAALNSYEPPKK